MTTMDARTWFSSRGGRSRLPIAPMAVDAALVLLFDAANEDGIRWLADCDGLDLDDLSLTFQLQPLGTRLALEHAGAMEHYDTTGPMFLVRALPFAFDLILGAGDLVAQAAVSDQPDAISALVSDFANSLFPLNQVELNSSSVPHALPSTDLVGVLRARAVVQDIDPATEEGRLEVLGESGRELHPKVTVHVKVDDVQDFPHTGAAVDIEFVVSTPTRSFVDRVLKRNSDTVPDDLQKSVKDVAGLLLVRVENEVQEKVASFVTSADANGVAKLARVDGQDVGLGQH